MELNIPYKVRAAIYVLNLIGAPFVAYALAKGWIGQLEVNLWAAELTAVLAMAGLNVSKKG